MTTRDKVYLQVDTFARWRVVDPLEYFRSARDERTAQSRLDDIIGGATLNCVARYDLIELIRTDKTRKVNPEIPAATGGSAPNSDILPITKGRAEIEQEIMQEARPSLKGLGIELLDVKFKRLNYSEMTQQKIFERMSSERAQIAERFRSEGAGEAARISGDRERELKRIQSEAYQKVQSIRGTAEAAAAEIYASAFNASPEAAQFYGFTKTLETYESVISADTTMVLSTDSDLYRLMKQLPALPTPNKAPKPTPAAPAVTPPAPAPGPEATATPAP
jgi:modulator of FtsH protease HflC